jgi:hypothetical protein
LEFGATIKPECLHILKDTLQAEVENLGGLMWNRTKNRDSNRCLNFGSVIFSIGRMAPAGLDLNCFLRLMCSGILAKPALLSFRPFTSAALLAA